MKTVLIAFFLVFSCNTNAQEKEAYEVLNAILNNILEKEDNILKAQIKKYPNNLKLKKELGKPLYINPKFSHLLTSRFPNAAWKNYEHYTHDFWILNFILKFNSIKDFDHKELNLVGDSTYYINEVKKAPATLDIQRLDNKRIQYYKTELETYNHIKQYEYLQEKGVDSTKLKEEKASMLRYENKHFQISYPIFSKNRKYAIVYTEKIGLGMQLWILGKADEGWKKVCVVHIGTIN